MSDSLQQLSTLMDGELPRDELRFLLRRLDSEPGLAQAWSRYQFAGAVLRRQVTVTLRPGFADAVMAQVAAERPARRRGATFLRWAGGGAIAAAVAVIALVSTRPAQVDAPTGVAALSTQTPARQDAPAMRVPAMVNFDYAQPASFDTVIPMPQYDVRYRYDGVPAEPLENPASAPYVLLVAPQRQLPARTPLRNPPSTGEHP
jgi:sigma-E factor negative regulatory protein RseA